MSERSRPLTVDEAVDRILSADKPFLLGVDFDGTLAEIVDHPEDAAPHPEALQALRTLAGRDDVEVAVVSGRGLSDLRQLLGEVPGAILVGEHGNDIGGEVPDDPLLAEAISLVEEVAAGSEGTTVERKMRSVAFHYRNTDPAIAESLLDRIRAWAADRPDIAVLEGKKVVELSTASKNKGDAIADLADGRPVIYLGDDTTDETVFATLRDGDVGIKVGAGPTKAHYRIEDIAGVVRILERIALASL